MEVSHCLSSQVSLPPGPPRAGLGIVKLTVYCYKTPRNTYLLDLQKTFGATFLFLELGGKLMTELKGLRVAAPLAEHPTTNGIDLQGDVIGEKPPKDT